MTSLDVVTAWVTNYRQAWESNDPAAIGALFAKDAAYFSEPYAKPWVGRKKIVTEGLKIKEEPGTTTFQGHPRIVTEDRAMIQATTTYPKGPSSNLWVLRLDNLGKARQFTEWWMKHPKKKA